MYSQLSVKGIVKSKMHLNVIVVSMNIKSTNESNNERSTSHELLSRLLKVEPLSQNSLRR